MATDDLVLNASQVWLPEQTPSPSSLARPQTTIAIARGLGHFGAPLTHRETGRGQCTLTASKSTNKKKRHYQWSNSDAPHWRPDAKCTWARRRTTSARMRAEERERARPNTEAGEAGQVGVNLHESLDQPGIQARERARPTVLKAVSRRSTANSSPKCMSRIMVQEGTGDCP